MPPTVEIKDSRYTIEVWCGSSTLFRTAYLEEFYEQLDAWADALPLTSVVWKAAGQEGDVQLYSLTGSAADGRTWAATVGLREGVEAPLYSFDVSDRFAEAEFEPQRTLRLTMVALSRAHGVSKVEVAWS